jgi:hypothetical protein
MEQTDEQEPIHLSDLHGAELTVERDGEREVLAGFPCDDYPDCDVCGHLNEEHVNTRDRSSTAPQQDERRFPWE